MNIPMFCTSGVGKAKSDYSLFFTLRKLTTITRIPPMVRLAQVGWLINTSGIAKISAELTPLKRPLANEYFIL